MKRSRKSKSVSWAHDVNLCQVKLFSSEDCPSKVGLTSCEHLQSKTSWMLPPHTIESNDCPPGFNNTRLGNQLADISGIPLIKWNCPPKFVMSCHWRVAAGDESTEIESENFREMRLLEAIYPRASDIPLGASVSTEIESETYNDSLTPLVPIIPIEEDECGAMELDSAALGNFSTSSVQMMASSNVQLEPAIVKSSIETSSVAVAVAAVEKPSEKLVDVGVDVVAAASAAFAVLMKSKEQGSLIDTNLLIKIFSDPTMIQNLTNILPLCELISGSPPTAISVPISVPKPATGSISLPVQESNMIPKRPNGNLPNVSNRVNSSETTLPQVSNIAASGVKPASVPDLSPAPDLQKVKTTISNGGNCSKKRRVPSQANVAPVNMVTKGQTLKDANYYKNLVRQHGDQKIGLNGNNHNLHNLNMVHEMKAENLKSKNEKYCIYYNTPKGCRNGVNCQYKHDKSHNWRTNNILETRSTKRMKLWG